MRDGCRWLPVVPLPAALGRGALRAAAASARLSDGWRWVPVAILIGALPFAVCWALRAPGHQAASAALLAFACLGLARRDEWLKGMALIALAFLAHSAAVFLATRADPQRAAELLPGAADYWQRQANWITTGRDPEYDHLNWLPAHAQLLLGTTLYSYTSLGALTFYQGFFEVDLMNFYDARLAAASRSEAVAVLLGWHVWSVLRGLGYLVITFEVISLSLQRLGGVPLSTPAARRLRWLLGLALIVGDGVAKAVLLEPVRGQLYENLSQALL